MEEFNSIFNSDFESEKIKKDFRQKQLQEILRPFRSLYFKKNKEGADFLESELKKSSEATTLLQHILNVAIQKGVSDLHFESHADKLTIRHRIGGNLLSYLEVSPQEASSLLSQIKLQAGCDVVNKNSTQEGCLSFQSQDRTIECRVSLLPTPYGENIVLRILDQHILQKNIEKLYLSKEQEALYEEISGLNSGLVIVCGPTGSGKTSSIYSFLRYLNSQELKIMTIEDPVEYDLGIGIVQVNAQPQLQFGFPEAIRAFMRHDPDILMIGEIRDSETAKYAIQAALTGHLVFTTLHAQDSCSVPIRLLDLGVEPYLIAESLNIIIGQRLVPKLNKSLNTQHSERGLVAEMIKVTDSFRELILNTASLEEIRAWCDFQGIVRLEHKLKNTDSL